MKTLYLKHFHFFLNIIMLVDNTSAICMQIGTSFGEDILHRGHSIITLSQNAQNMDPRSPLVRNCSILVAPPPLERSNLNLNSSTPNLPSRTTTLTTTPQKSSKFYGFLVLQPAVISPCKYHKGIFPERSPSSPETNGINY